MKYHTLLFDADNTLFDFPRAEDVAFFRTAREFNIKADDTTLVLYKSINEPLWRELEKGAITKEELLVERYRCLFLEMGVDKDYIEFNKQYLYNLGFGTQLLPYALNLVKDLADQYKIIIVTNGVADTQKRRINASDIGKYIDNIIVSEDAGFSKPRVEFFDYAFRKCNITDKKGVLVIGDSLEADIQGAINYGLDSCLFSSKSTSYTNTIFPTHTIASLTQLYDILGIER